MSQHKVVAHATAADLDLNDIDTLRLVQQAQEADQADHSLTIRQALRKYRRAVFWAMFLSTTLIMEGYDLVIVSGI
jgi:SP family general alpha glucoside:H+ symporter-like MFS transporter